MIIDHLIVTSYYWICEKMHEMFIQVLFDGYNFQLNYFMSVIFTWNIDPIMSIFPVMTSTGRRASIWPIGVNFSSPVTALWKIALNMCILGERERLLKYHISFTGITYMFTCSFKKSIAFSMLLISGSSRKGNLQNWHKEFMYTSLNLYIFLSHSRKLTPIETPSLPVRGW